MDELTIEAYNQQAKNYDRETASFWKLFPSTIIDEFVSAAKGKVLDVGSGPGRDALILTKNGLNVVCLDASQTMVDLCKSKNLDAVRADFMDLPFSQESFDAVWAYTSLLHIPKSDFPKALEEINRVLKSGGIFGLGMIEGTEEKYKTSTKVSLPRYFSYYNKEEIVESLLIAGFEPLYFEVFKPNTKNYLNFIIKKSSHANKSR